MMIKKNINTKFEFDFLMNKLEADCPKMRWIEGQKPTQWHPRTYSKRAVCIDTDSNSIRLDFR